MEFSLPPGAISVASLSGQTEQTTPVSSKGPQPSQVISLDGGAENDGHPAGLALTFNPVKPAKPI